MTTASDQNSLLDRIARLSSAEDIFDFVGLAYAPEVLNVSRLHIMKRFGTYLREVDFEGRTEVEMMQGVREILARAYQDFVTSTPLKEKVFKVFQDEEAKRRARFVGIDTLKIAQR